MSLCVVPGGCPWSSLLFLVSCYFYSYFCFNFLLQEAHSNALCRRLELKDLLPTLMQRLTKYPLFIEKLIHYAQRE